MKGESVDLVEVGDEVGDRAGRIAGRTGAVS
jgi:hypothetical protein